MIKHDIKFKILLSLLIQAIFLVGCVKNKSAYIEDNYNSKVDYRYELIDYNSFKDKISDGDTFLAIFTRNDCEYCLTFINNFSDFMNENYKNYIVYFIDSSSMSVEDKEDILINFDISTVPSIVSVKGGKIINLEIGEPSKNRLNEIISELRKD